VVLRDATRRRPARRRLFFTALGDLRVARRSDNFRFG
jgi:hypothetical protein